MLEVYLVERKKDTKTERKKIIRKHDLIIYRSKHLEYIIIRIVIIGRTPFAGGTKRKNGKR